MRYGKMLSILVVLACLAPFAGCEPERYDLEACTKTEENINYTTKYETKDFTAYFESSLSSDAAYDWIDVLDGFTDSVQDLGLRAPVLFIGGNIIPHTSDGTVHLPSDLSEEESLSWLLSSYSSEDLPFGVCAGLSATILSDKVPRNVLSPEDAKTLDYLTELQFPLYEEGNLPDVQRNVAYDFAYTLVHDLVDGGRKLSELLSMTREEVNSFMEARYELSLPNYTFAPASAPYEYLVEQGCFTYYIDREFRDAVLAEERFCATYNFLSDWLKDNWECKLASDEAFGIEEIPHIEVSLRGGTSMEASPGYSSNNTILLFSAGGFSREYIQQILLNLDLIGSLSDTVEDLQASSSKYSRRMWYDLYSGVSHYNYSEDVLERDCYRRSMILYKEKTGSVSEETFDFGLFADCFSALYTEKEVPLVSNLQKNSFSRYIVKNYGNDAFLKLNSDPESKVDGKSVNELRGEWYNYLQREFFSSTR